MVDESLIAYLGDTQFVRSLFNPDFTLDGEKPEEYQRVAKRLKAIKILDPACGSGAFPMGLLNRIYQPDRLSGPFLREYIRRAYPYAFPAFDATLLVYV